MRRKSPALLAMLGLAFALPAQDEAAETTKKPEPVIPAMADATIDEAIASIEAVIASDAFAENPSRALSQPFYRFIGKILRGGQLSDEQEARLVGYLDDVREKAPSEAKQIETMLYQIRFLTIGHKAPDIVGEDIDGVPFKLSDYRGKVVVLDFWGDW